ncbi:MAG: class C sortase [Oscillospiraceae bacterium]|nr:class C sortase [Oscillospiraceae bacterium]
MKKRSKLPTILLFVAFFVGLSLMLYPSVSNYWNSLHQTKAINTYIETAADLSEEENASEIEAAHEYNRNILDRQNFYSVSKEEKESYEKLLNVSGLGIMGYIDIPRINVSLPIYHGTSDAVLQIGVGHIEWSSLPVGGESTHTVLSGHRGLPSAKLFSDLDKVREGDTFSITVLDTVVTYEVDQILIILPTEINDLDIEPGEDYCTLITCTPYGINTHRLLVRGRRTENAPEKSVIYVSNEAFRIDPMVVTPVVAAPILLVLFIVLLVRHRRKRK